MAYPTVSNVKTHLTITGSGDDATLTNILAAVVDWVEQWTGHSFVAASAQTIKVVPDYPNLLGRRVLLIGHDLRSVTSITNGDGESISSSDYTLLPLDGPPYHKIELHVDSGLRWWRGVESGYVTIVGDVGFSSDVPDDVKLAILELCGYFYRARSTGAGGAVRTATRQGLIIEADELPGRVLELLGPYRRLRA